jgi:hypothetical protein
MSSGSPHFGWTRAARSLVWSLTAGLLGAGGLVAAPGCVEDVGLVDRTSPYKLDKKMFEGVWLYGQTTIDVPYSSAVSFAGETPFLGGTKKIIFDLQEDWLIAYPIVETIEGSEKDWKTNSIRKYWDPNRRDEFQEFYVGPPVARWPIESHFDVQRSYNTFNGSQSNEVVENTSDRPWYERDYIRVSWHRQGIQDFFFSLKGGGDSYFVGEEKPWDPDEFEVDPNGGYFDFVIRTVTWSAGQERCNIYDLSGYDCAQTEVKVRHAFRRFDPRRDYEPIRYHNDEHQNRFGFFATDRYAYDYDWGPTYKGTVAFANRWNLWDKSYRFIKPTDGAGVEQTLSCMVDKDCDRDAGQRCQKDTSWFAPGYCATPEPLPYKERGLRPIIYHLNAEWHPDYIDAAYATGDAWSDVFKEAIAWLYLYEEKGTARPKACTSHADCTTADLLIDRTVSVIDDGVACHTDAACGNGTCATDGFCAAVTACNANRPCAIGQTCSGGQCLENGAPALERIRTQIPRSSTIIYSGAATVVTHDNFPQRIRATLASGHAFVRFVHLDPAGGDLSLTANGTLIEGGAFDASRDLDIDDPASANFFDQVPAGTGVTVSVSAGGATKAETTIDIVANSHYLVVYNGKDIITLGASFQQTTQGVRAIHAGFGEGGIDLGVEGIRLSENLAYQASSGYVSIAGAQQRVTISRAGGRGDFTCYQAETLGYCAGWGAQTTDADRDRVRQIKAELPAMFVVCQNQFDPIEAQQTVAEDAKATYFDDARYTRADGYNPCGDATRVAHPTKLKKMGDARYSFFYWIHEPQRSGPLGYGPSAADPETGEIIVAAANIYGGAMQTYGQYASDIIDLVNGDLSTADMMTGNWIRDYLKTLPEEDAETRAIYGSLSTDAFDGHSLPTEFAEAPRNLPALNPSLERAKALGLKAPSRWTHDYDFPELLALQRDPAAFRTALQASLPKVDPKFYHDRLNRVSGTWIEDLLINDEVKLAAKSIDPNGAMNPADLRKALSPATWSSKFALRKEQERMQLLGEHCLYLGEFADDAIYGIAKEFKNSGLSRDEIRKKLSSAILQGVLEHEVGHTVGLRHNFSGSTDVFNFKDEYYQIREKEFILCQDDNWCDDVNGEACAIKACDADGDCPAGTLCNENQCSAPSGAGLADLVPTGTCSLPVESVPPCTKDRECGDGNTCFQNRCYAPRAQYAPRPWMTDNEKAKRRTEYQYTTVMDYMGRVNGDIHSLGKYDYAAIRFGYTQLVDTYTDTSLIDERIARTAQIAGGTPAQYSFMKNAFDYWPTRGTGTFHAFNYITNYIGVEQNLLRTPVPYHTSKYQREMAINDVREFLDMEYVEVPYAYCSDEYRGNMGCYYFDQGIDMGEMAQSAMDQLDNYYIFDAFKRERLYYGSYGNPMGYYARIMDRYLRVLGDVGMYYALYDNYFFRYSWYDSWKTSPLGGRTMEQAAIDSFAKLKDTISSPAPGSYKFDEATGAYVNVSFKPGAEGADFDIPFGIGRFPYTQFGSDLGYYYYQFPLWFGSFWEKLGALVTLTDSTAYFVDTYVGEQIDIGVGTSLGYNTVFADDLNNFLGGIIAGDLEFYAGRNVQGRYVPPSISGESVANKPVVPAINNFTLKLYAALYGLAFMPAGFDPQFIDRLAVFLEGEASQFTEDAGLDLTEVRFEDPIGGKVYVAYTTNYGDLGEPKIDVAANLVLKGQDLADDWAGETDPAAKAKLQRELGEVREMLDLLRTLNHVYGTSTLGF